MRRERPLTARQYTVLRFIEMFVAENRYPPSMREIATHIGITSTNGVTDHLNKLERKGYIERHPSVSRGIQIIRHTKEHLETERHELVKRLAQIEAALEAIEGQNNHDF